MIRVSISYDNDAEASFDHDYYLDKHIPLLKKLMQPLGLKSVEVDRCVDGPVGKGSPAKAIVHMSFDDLDSALSALQQTAKELTADVPNYTKLTPKVQISDIVLS